MGISHMASISNQPELVSSALNAQFAQETSAICKRRSQLKLASGKRLGLALSGGGIRSATFCLGLCRGLAAQGLLKHFDFLSTVSGGSYIGALLGRLFQSAPPSEVEAGLARSNTVLLWWLRRNGRFLTPAGASDIGTVVVTYIRAWIAIAIESGFWAVMLGCVVVAPHVWHWNAASSWLTPFARLQSLWWMLAISIAIVILPGLLVSFWTTRSNTSRAQLLRDLAMQTLTALALVWLVGMHLLPTTKLAWGPTPLDNRLPDSAFWIVGAWLAAASIAFNVAINLATIFRTQFGRHAEMTQIGHARTERTAQLVFVVKGIALFLIFGALDQISWEIYRWINESRDIATTFFGSIGAGTFALIVLRAFLENLQVLTANTNRSATSKWGAAAINIAGYVALGAMVLFWLTVVQFLVFGMPTTSFSSVASSGVRWVVLLSVTVGWFVITGANSETPNASSLHGFYRSRLARTYLSIVNPDRFGSATSWSEYANSKNTLLVQGVTSVNAGDDLSLKDYKPEENGGPIHLVNVCINQTYSNRSGIDATDRKGVGMTVSHRGYEFGPGQVRATEVTDPHEPLSRWIAVSGAAMSTGAGALTRQGLALIFFFFGVRLGYWWVSEPTERRSLSWVKRQGLALFAKPLMFLDEALARFHGTERARWFLSDGGHFENTGAYPLIKRELDFIIVADCGQDAQYRFNDLEELVRKVRVDFGAIIEFYDADQAQRLFSLPSTSLIVLPPEKLADNSSARGVLLARVSYQSGRTGTMLVIKPNLHGQLDLDVLAYAQRNPLFPQQPTSDQFFDEAQWESYQRLGEDIGGAFTLPWLNQLPCWERVNHPSGIQTAPLQSGKFSTSDAQAAKLPWRTAASAAAVGTTLGLGATGTLLLSAWQGWEQVRQSKTAHVKQINDDVDQLVKLLGAPTIAVGTSEHYHATDKIETLISQTESIRGESVTERRVAGVLNYARDRCTRQPSEESLKESCEKLEREKSVRGQNSLMYWPTEKIEIQMNPTKSQAPAAPESTQAPMAPGPTPLLTKDPSKDTPVRETIIACKARSKQVSEPLKIFLHIYDEEQRKIAEEVKSNLKMITVEKKGAVKEAVQGIENVTATALRRGNRAPFRWGVPTVIYHNQTESNCAYEIASILNTEYKSVADVRPLPTSLKGESGVIELYFPKLISANK
jgi:hypothetical protein